MKIIKPKDTLPDYKSKYLEAARTIKIVRDILYLDEDISAARYLLTDWINLHHDFLSQTKEKK